MQSAVRRVPRQTVRWGIALVAVLAVLGPLGAGSAVAADDRQVSAGTFTWGVKKSFRSYVTSPIAGGEITPSRGASQASGNGEFSFTGGKGTARATGGGVFTFTGAVRFYGHDGDLDVTLADPKINVNGNGNGALEVQHTFAGRTKTVQVAEVTGATVVVSGDRATLRGAKTALTQEGKAIFSMDGTTGSSFYEAGDDLDPASADLTLKKPAEEPDPTDPGPTDPDPGPTDPEPTDPEPTDPAPSPTPTTPKPSNPGSGSTAPKGQAGTLSWGVKSSFRTYVGGPIAKGRVTTSGHATTSNGSYVFPQRSTSAKPPSAKGTTSYRGQVNFFGHGGDLDMYLRNPRVVVTSGTQGKLVVDAKPTGASGFRSVTVSTLNLSQGSKSSSNGSVMFRGVPVKLSSAGTTLFAWEGRSMYPAGTAMDPVTFTIGSDKKVSGSGKSTTSTPKGSPSAAGGSAGSGGSGAGGSGTDTSAAGSGSASSAAAAASRTGAGSLSWGLRQSFRDYITGPIAHGSISVSGGASSSGGSFTFPQSGAAKGDGGADYRGAVNFRGHGGILNLSFSDPEVSIDSARSGSLTAQVGGRRISVATLNLGAGAKSESDGATAYTDVPATLTSQGSTLFTYNGSSFYPAGSAMDPVSFTVGSPGSAASGSGSSAAQTVASAGDSADSGGSALSPEAAEAAKAKASKSACVATGSDLTWGVKESFRSYISGTIANGGWSTKGGAHYSTPNFTWSKGKGTFDEKSRTGAVEFPGTVGFTGHDGKLNTTISDPEVRLEGDRAVIVLNSEGATMEAAMDGRDDTKSYLDVPFVEVDLSKAKVETKGGRTTITAEDAPTSLTKQGAAAFSTYTEGTDFDPISFTITAKSSCIAPNTIKDANSDASTAITAPSDGGSSGGSGALPMWAAWVGGGVAGAGLAAGGTVLLMRRRLTAGAVA